MKRDMAWRELRGDLQGIEKEKQKKVLAEEVKILNRKFKDIYCATILRTYYDSSKSILYTGYCKHKDLSIYSKLNERTLTLANKIWMMYQIT